MKKLGQIILVVVLLCVSMSLIAKEKRITIAGSTTVLPIAQATAEAFMDIHPDVNITVRGGGSSVGIASIISGTVDIGDASRHIKTKEILKAKELGVNPVENVIANDGIAVVIHPTNPIEKLSINQLKGIYTGKINNWKELGGPNMPIVVISRDVSSGTFEVFNKFILEGSKLKEGALMLASNNAVASTVATTPGAIGYVGLGYLNPKIKAIKVEGIMPTVKTVQNKTYPLSRTLHMYTNGKPKGLVKEYIDFVLSPAGQKIVEEMGFIKIK